MLQWSYLETALAADASQKVAKSEQNFNFLTVIYRIFILSHFFQDFQVYFERRYRENRGLVRAKKSVKPPKPLSQDQRNQTSKRLKLKNSWIRSRSKSSEVNPEVNKNFVKRRQVKLRLFRSQKKTRQNEVGQMNLWKLVVKSLGKT